MPAYNIALALLHNCLQYKIKDMLNLELGWNVFWKIFDLEAFWSNLSSPWKPGMPAAFCPTCDMVIFIKTELLFSSARAVLLIPIAFPKAEASWWLLFAIDKVVGS